jgi:hypothetical protein
MHGACGNVANRHVIPSVIRDIICVHNTVHRYVVQNGRVDLNPCQLDTLCGM